MYTEAPRAGVCYIAVIDEAMSGAAHCYQYNRHDTHTNPLTLLCNATQ